MDEAFDAYVHVLQLQTHLLSSLFTEKMSTCNNTVCEVLFRTKFYLCVY